MVGRGRRFGLSIPLCSAAQTRGRLFARFNGPNAMFVLRDCQGVWHHVDALTFATIAAAPVFVLRTSTRHLQLLQRHPICSTHLQATRCTRHVSNLEHARSLCGFKTVKRPQTTLNGLEEGETLRQSHSTRHAQVSAFQRAARVVQRSCCIPCRVAYLKLYLSSCRYSIWYLVKNRVKMPRSSYVGLLR